MVRVSDSHPVQLSCQGLLEQDGYSNIIFQGWPQYHCMWSNVKHYLYKLWCCSIEENFSDTRDNYYYRSHHRHFGIVKTYTIWGLCCCVKQEVLADPCQDFLLLQRGKRWDKLIDCTKLWNQTLTSKTGITQLLSDILLKFEQLSIVEVMWFTRLYPGDNSQVNK